MHSGHVHPLNCQPNSSRNFALRSPATFSLRHRVRRLGAFADGPSPVPTPNFVAEFL
jgi:hypothetical protein